MLGLIGRDAVLDAVGAVADEGKPPDLRPAPGPRNRPAASSSSGPAANSYRPVLIVAL